MREKAYAKVNIFLKITGKREGYHTLFSRFMRLPSLWDTIIFEEKPHPEPFRLIGEFGCTLEQNSIYRAYRLLMETKQRNRIELFFRNHTVKVEKRIPEFAGLGGGSSDAATFLLMANEILDLKLSRKDLEMIGMQIGADVPFFLSGYESANVTGIGEIITPFEEEPLDLALITPADIRCNTAAVYRRFRNAYMETIDTSLAEELGRSRSASILEHYDALMLNDLLRPALDLCPALQAYLKPGRFFSGSGSTFFGKKDG